MKNVKIREDTGLAHVQLKPYISDY